MHIRVGKAAHYLHDRVDFADVTEKLVAESFARARAFHQTGDIHELDRGRHNFLRTRHFTELFQTRTRVSAMAISQNVGTTITALLPALFATVAPPGAANIPLTIGAITFAITIIAALAAMSARETFRIQMKDLGQPGATPLDKQEYERLRALSFGAAGVAAE